MAKHVFEKSEIIPVKKSGKGKTLVKVVVGIVVFNIAVGKVISKTKEKFKQREDDTKDGDIPEYHILFDGRDVKVDGEFTGTKVNTIFGGANIDLSEAKINQDVYIECKTILGGIELILPKGINIVEESKVVLGGISNSIPNVQDEEQPTVYLNSKVILGGIDIRNKDQEHFSEEEITSADNEDLIEEQEDIQEEEQIEEQIEE